MFDIEIDCLTVFRGETFFVTFLLFWRVSPLFILLNMYVPCLLYHYTKFIV